MQSDKKKQWSERCIERGQKNAYFQYNAIGSPTSSPNIDEQIPKMPIA